MLIADKTPSWRLNARAGQYLADIEPKAHHAEASAKADANSALQTFIRPSAQDRWMANYLNYYRPQIVENTIRSAMSGNLVAQWLMFDLMEATWPRLQKNLNEIKDAVIDLDWALMPFALRGQKPTAEAFRRRAIIDEMLWTMSPDATQNENDFEDTIRDVLDAVGKGISVLEIDWQKKPTQIADLRMKNSGSRQPSPSDNSSIVNPNSALLWSPRATRWVHPRFYGYPAWGTSVDRLMLFSQEVMFSNPAVKFENTWEEFPENSFIVSMIKQKSGHPLSSSMLRTLGFFWAAQNFTWEWFINYAQIFGMPIRWATYDSTRKELLPLVSQMLQQMGAAGWGVFPDGTSLDLKEGGGNARENAHKILIDAADQIADILILGQTLTTTQGDRGSQSLGKIHKSVRDEKIDATAARAAKILNRQLLPAICRLNYGDDSECPYFQPTSRDSKAGIEKAQQYQILQAIGMDFGREWIYDQFDVPVPQSGEALLPRPQSQPADSGIHPPTEPAVDDVDCASAALARATAERRTAP